MSDIDSELQEKIDYARSIHQTAVANMAEWETVYKGDYGTPKDKAGVEDGDIPAYKPVRPRAIVSKMLALLSVRARMQNQVVPHQDTQQEENICTRLEQYLDGYQWRIQAEKNQPVFRHAVQWALLRGKMVLIPQYVPRFVGSQFFPIRTLAPDPATVFEVSGENGIIYYVRESSRYVWELSRELDKKIAAQADIDTVSSTPVLTGGVRKAGSARGAWFKPGKLSDKKPTDKCAVVEYWDGEYYAVVIDDEVALAPTEHDYGFCPIAVAYIEDTPFEGMEWKGQGIIAPIVDAIKNEAILTAKMGDALSSFFYPLVFWATPDGRAGWINPYAASVSAIPVDAKVQIYMPQPNIPIVEAYRSWLLSDVNIMTLPDVAWGMEPRGTDKSGFAISQVLGQVMDRIEDKKENLQFAFGAHFGQVLRLTAQFSGRKEQDKFEVMVTADRRPRSADGGRRSRRLLSIGADEVADHYQVLTQITPTLPTEKMAMIQQMNALREPNKLTGLPLVDDKSLREMYPEIFENVDAINLRVDEEYWRKKLPEVEQWEQDEWLANWRKSHKPHGTRALDYSQMPKERLVQIMQMRDMMMEDPQAFAQALARMGTPPRYGMANEPNVPNEPNMPITQSPDRPGMLPPEMLPPQMQGVRQPNPQDVAVEQMARAMMPRP